MIQAFPGTQAAAESANPELYRRKPAGIAEVNFFPKLKIYLYETN